MVAEPADPAPTLADAIARYIRAGFTPQTGKRRAERQAAWDELVRVLQSRKHNSDHT